MASFYLASRFGRRDELVGYAHDLQKAGHTITSRWLTDEPDLSNATDGERSTWAGVDVHDVLAADHLISFTEQPEETSLHVPGRARGGRHVEFGLAYGADKHLWIVGPRENIFHWLVIRSRIFASWEEALPALEAL